MFGFFQVIFTAAAPLQDGVEQFFGWLGGLAADRISNGLESSFVSDALLGGVGSVLVFLPQIVLLFLMIALLEGIGYMARAAFLMDRVMSKAGLEGRAFVALLSSVACAVPSNMATRTLPSARDRIATMMGAPLTTCSARLPVYVLLIGLVVPSDAGWGPISAYPGLLVPVHPEPVDDDEQSLRWAMPAGTLDLVGVPAELPEVLQCLLDENVLELLTVEPAAIRTRLTAGLSWRDHGARVRTALQTALGTPQQWRTDGSTAPADEQLTLAVQQVIDGDVGDYIRSHGGRVELVSARDHVVEIQLSGACSHCPASDVTLTDRLDVGIRTLYPRLERLTARTEPGSSAGQRMLRLLPTRRR